MRPAVLPLLGVWALAALTLSMGTISLAAGSPPVLGAPLAVGSSATPSPHDLPRDLTTHDPVVPSTGSNSSLRNTLVGAPCNSLPERQVSQTVDPTTGYLYETFIGCGGIGFARSLDGGYSFQPAYYLPDTNSHLITNPNGDANAAPLRASPSGTPLPARPITNLDNSSAWDPGIAVAPDGTIYVVYSIGYLDGYLPGAQPAVAWSDDHGASFQGYQNVTTWVNGTYDDRPSIAVAPNGTVYVAWTYAPNDTVTCPAGTPAPCTNGTTSAWLWCVTKNSCAFERGQFQIVVAASYDQGRNWTRPWNVTPLQTHTQSVTAEIAVTSGGMLDALVQQFDSGGAPRWALGVGEETFTQSADGGATWGTPRILSTLNFSNATWWVDGSLKVDPSGTLYVGFSSYVAATNVSTAWAMASLDGGYSWSTPLALSHGSGPGAAVDVTVSGNGAGDAYALWEMNNTTGHYWEVWGAALSSNGTSEGPIELVSEQAGYPSDWVGNTLGVDPLGGDAYALAFTVGAYQPAFGNTQSEVFFAAAGLAVPPAPAQVTLTPGPAEIGVQWTEVPGNATVTGFLVLWWLEGVNVGNLTTNATASSAVIPSLLPDLRFEVTVAAFNGAGTGPIGPTGNITLTAWTVYRGAVTPAGAAVVFDGASVPSPAGLYDVNVTFGGHSLEVSAPDYASASLTLGEAWNGTVWRNVTLALLPSVVRGTVFPATSTVTWDGSSVALTAGTFDIPAAADTNHTLNATFPGFSPLEVLVDVPPNATVWENLTLRPLPGTLFLTVVPSDANVWVNGTAVALTPNGTASVSLSAGTYPIRATAPGFQPYLSQATLLPGTTVNVSIAMVKNATSPSNGTSSTSTPLYVSPLFLGAVVVLVAVLGVSFLLAVRSRRREDRRPVPVVPVDESELDRERQLRGRVPDEGDRPPPT